MYNCDGVDDARYFIFVLDRCFVGFYFHTCCGSNGGGDGVCIFDAGVEDGNICAGFCECFGGCETDFADAACYSGSFTLEGELRCDMFVGVGGLCERRCGRWESRWKAGKRRREKRLQATATTLVQFVVSRAVVGEAGMFVVQPSPDVDCQAGLSDASRQVHKCFLAMYYLGAILAAWATFGTQDHSGNWSWRIPTILQAGYPLVQPVFFWALSESPRYGF